MDCKYPGFYTIDVEDYFHILDVRGTPSPDTWDNLPSRVEIGLRAHFELLEKFDAKATCFFLGYIAKRFPHLVREALQRGHEIASHGMFHTVVAKQGKERFAEDATTSKKLLEDISGREVRGWRCAGFSFDKSCNWYFQTLVESGYKYDSSLLPNRRKHHLVPGITAAPFWINTASGNLLEVPISISNLGVLEVSMFGGGYLRFFPQAMVSRHADLVLQERPLVIYIHPRELDPSHPKINMNLFRYFKSYVNMNTVESKLSTLLAKTNFIRITDYEQNMLGQILPK